MDDPSITVRFPVIGKDKTYFLVWTTTPWTLPANLALAVGASIDYVFVEHGGETLILATQLVDKVLGEGPHTIVRQVKGEDLMGLRYQRLFDELPAKGDICRVLTADFVSTDDGTGIVHTAPAYGVDDLALGQAHGLPVVHGIGLDGCFKDEVTPVQGQFFKDADPTIIEILRERGLLFRSETHRHNYPFGWRTGDPLIYYAKNAWYIRTTAVRERMVELLSLIHI